MADSLLEQVTNLLKRYGRHLNRKVSEILLILVNHKSAGSLGAIAGFAVAILFAWKFLRPPSRPPRSQHKRIGSASTSSNGSQTDEVASNSEEVHSLHPNTKDIDAIDEGRPPMKATLGQIVRKKLNGSRKMTCQLLGIILEESSPEALQKHATVRLSVVEVLLEIAKSCDLYLMERILDDESEERALSALEDAGLFQTGGLIKEKVLFCSTEIGRLSFVRQLDPDWHIDTNADIISQLARFIRRQLYVTPSGSSQSPEASNVLSSTSLEHYFSSLDR